MADTFGTERRIDDIDRLPIEIASFGHSGKHISQFVHLSVMSRAMMFSGKMKGVGL